MIKHICIPSLFLPITNILQNPKFWLIVDKQLVQVYKICMYSVAKARIIAPYRFANGVNKFFFFVSIHRLPKDAGFKNFYPEFLLEGGV